MSQFGDGGLLLYWSRIRKNVTHREQRTYIYTENPQITDKKTEKAITEATLVPWITGLSRPIEEKAEWTELNWVNLRAV